MDKKYIMIVVNFLTKIMALGNAVYSVGESQFSSISSQTLLPQIFYSVVQKLATFGNCLMINRPQLTYPRSGCYPCPGNPSLGWAE